MDSARPTKPRPKSRTPRFQHTAIGGANAVRRLKGNRPRRAWRLGSCGSGGGGRAIEEAVPEDSREHHRDRQGDRQVDRVPADQILHGAGEEARCRNPEKTRKSLIAWTLAFSSGR